MAGTAALQCTSQDWKFFNPTMVEATVLLRKVKVDMIANNTSQSTLPKRVKLSDSGNILIVGFGVSVVQSHDWYGLDFNSGEYVYMTPPHNHMGNAYTKPGPIGPVGRSSSRDVYMLYDILVLLIKLYGKGSRSGRLKSAELNFANANAGSNATYHP